MTNLNDVMNETLFRLTAVIDVDYLFRHAFEDGIPLTKHQAQAICDLSEETVNEKGFYTMANLVDSKGTVFTFYTAQGEIKRVVQLNFPMVGSDRKIPKRSWVKNLFEHIGYPSDSHDIKYVFRAIDSHVRDGGTWQATMNDQTITFILKMNGKVKRYLEFHKEDLSL